MMVMASVAAGAAGFSYQSTLRGGDGALLTSQPVQLVITISGGEEGEALYMESHNAVTDARGTIDIAVGEGSASFGRFDEVDWLGQGPYFMRVEATPQGGSPIVSVQQLLSVPMASHAEATRTLSTTGADGTEYRLVVDDYGNIEPVKMPKGYTRLVFHDSFNGSGLPDADKWSYDGEHINDELQYYTTAREENVFMQDGLLHIRCINNDTIRNEQGEILNNYVDKKTGESHCITSARIRTKGKGDWTYCYVEARIKVPVASGTWPAVWMMPTDNAYGYWPNSGEIDIMEHVGNEPLVYHCALHHRNGTKGGSKQMPDADDWHVIGFKWTAEKMEWLVDDRVYCRITNPGTNWGDWPYDRDFHLILNLAFGGNWGGQGGIDPEALPLDFLIDYVRVFQE